MNSHTKIGLRAAVLLLGALPLAATVHGQAASAPPRPAAEGQEKDNEAFQRRQFQEDAQQQQGAQGDAQRTAPIDLTGYWVAVVTEDWRWRMLTPPKGDYASVPLSAAGRKEADRWSEAQDGSCKAYGAGGLMRMPTRLHITWATANQLRVDTDWGEQTRTFYFKRNEVPTGAAASLQGTSIASWEHPTATGAASNPPPPGGYLKVVTTNLSPGWLRRNGVPYSAQARVTEYYQTFIDPKGRLWFDVTTQVEDPLYLQRSFITSSDFRREPDGSKWAPHPCKTP